MSCSSFLVAPRLLYEDRGALDEAAGGLGEPRGGSPVDDRAVEADGQWQHVAFLGASGEGREAPAAAAHGDHQSHRRQRVELGVPGHRPAERCDVERGQRRWVPQPGCSAVARS
jgi:hypothetical protein